MPQLLASIQRQTCQNFKIVISDNASSDATWAIAQEAARADARIGVYRNDTNIGGNRNFEKAFSYCDTPYFIWLANDDLIEPEFLQTCLGGLGRDAEVVLSGCTAMFIDAKGEPLKLDAASGCYMAPYFETPLPREKAHPGESRNPVERFHDFFPSYFASHIHGLLRASAVRQTAMLGSHMNGPALFLADLALQGRFVTSERRLFKRRYHAACSEAMSWETRVTHTGTQSSKEAFLYNTRRFLGMILRNRRLTYAQQARLAFAVIHHTVWFRCVQASASVSAFARAVLTAKRRLPTPT